jgi:hypothetical protein
VKKAYKNPKMDKLFVTFCKSTMKDAILVKTAKFLDMRDQTRKIKQLSSILAFFTK